MNTEQFQEFIRVIDATIGRFDNEGMVTGKNAQKITNFLLSFETLTRNLTNEVKSLSSTLVECNDVNVRREVKDLYMYPKKRGEYDPWIILPSEMTNIEDINDQIKDIQVQVVVVDGKVYGRCRGIGKLLHDKFPLGVLNPEHDHVTLVNSDVVSRLNNVKEFVDQYCGTQGELRMVDLRTTTSNDWPLFSQCWVVSLRCAYLSEFVDRFNEHYDTKIKNQFHTTFAIEPRYLF